MNTYRLNPSRHRPLDAPASNATVELMTGLLSIATSDVEVVARELSLSPAMSERTRRALDCLQCLVAVLETGAYGRLGEEAEAWSEVEELVKEYLEAWPDDHLAMLTSL